MSSREQKAMAMEAGETPLPTSQGASIDNATPSSLGRGVKSSGPADATEARSTAHQSIGPGGRTGGVENENVDAEQLATLAEGKVADAVQGKPGVQKVPGTGEVVRDDFSEGIERKKKEQAEARQKVKEQRQQGVDVDGSLGQGRPGNEDNSAV